MSKTEQKILKISILKFKVSGIPRGNFRDYDIGAVSRAFDTKPDWFFLHFTPYDTSHIVRNIAQSDTYILLDINPGINESNCLEKSF